MQTISNYNYFNQNNNQNPKNKKVLNIVIICIIIVLLITAGLIGAIYYLNLMQQKALKIYVDDKKISINEDTFIIDNSGKIYVAIKDIANILGYETHNGEYKVYSEDPTKCYVENANETASFFLNSDKISKVAPNSTDEYVDYTISQPVKKENNKLYVISDGIQIGCNVKLIYDTDTNTIKIYTLPYLVTYYSPTITKYGYKGISTDFNNQKAILYDMFVVQNTSEKFGVIDIKNNEIIGCRYDNMKFDESNKEFFVTNALSKVGIILANGTNKINIEYDEIKVLSKDSYIVRNNNKYGIIDKDGKIKVNVSYNEIKVLDDDLGLYIVKYNNKYGVIDENDKQIIYWEYDSIGLDTKSFENEKNSNKYLLFGNAIPVKINSKWGLFDIKGNQILQCEYDSFGCIATTLIKDKVVNNVLVIPECESIVVCKDKKYGIVNKDGKVLVQTLLNSVYSTTTAGVNTYYMNFEHNGENIEYEVLWYLEQMGLYNTKNNNSSAENNNIENNSINNNINNNTTNNNIYNNNEIVDNNLTNNNNIENNNTGVNL